MQNKLRILVLVCVAVLSISLESCKKEDVSIKQQADKPVIQAQQPVPSVPPAPLVVPVYTDRSQIPDQYKWDLTDMFPNPEAWKIAAQNFKAQLSEIEKFKGHLGDSAENLYQALTLFYDLKGKLDSITLYARFSNELDTRAAEFIALKQQSDQVEAAFNDSTSFIKSEILSLDKSKIDLFVSSNANLDLYKFYLENILRMHAHTGNAQDERLIAWAGPALNLATQTYKALYNVELPAPEIQLSTGEKFNLTTSNFFKHRAVQNPNDRILVFQTYFSVLEKFKETFAALLYGQITQHIFYKNAYHYDSSIQSALDPDNIPTTVYTQLIEDVHINLSTLHRYLKLRQKILGLKELRYEDLNVPLVPDVDRKYSAEEAKEIVLKALDPLGTQAREIIQNAYDHRWIDFFSTPGKYSGDYSKGGLYSNHPRIFLNYDGSYSMLATLAHELGHTIHKVLINRATPSVYREYSDFIAEVSSMTDEVLLFRYSLNQAISKKEKINLLGARLEYVRQSFFGQTMLAEFELKAHQMAEKGEPITGTSLKKLFLDIMRQYYGHDAGVCQVDEIYGMVWANIPHFFKYNFMLFQYATSLTASTAVANRILDEASAIPPSTHTRDAYLKILSLGGSKYPADLLKDIGIDMTTSEPVESVIKEMNQIMDEIEKLMQNS